MSHIVFVHGYSAETGRRPYGSLPGLLRNLTDSEVTEIKLSRYLSMEDGAGVEDLTAAFDKALRHHGLMNSGATVIAHSLGALVVRNWMRRFRNASPSAVQTAIYLAPAMFGSGWAHIGRSLVTKWLRLGWTGTGARGLGCLKALELGSEWTTNLHLDLLDAPSAVSEYVVSAGASPSEYGVVPIKYANEAESDGVIRISASNLNFQHLKIVRNPGSPNYSVQRFHEPGFTVSPASFYLVSEASHSGKASGILQGKTCATRVVRLIEALVSSKIPAPVSLPKHSYSQLLFRLRDQYQIPVTDYSIHLNGGGVRFSDKHVNRLDPQNIVFYIQSDPSSLEHCTLEIEAEAPHGSSHIRYSPLKLQIPPQLRRRYIRPGMTTVIDVELQRESDQGLFTLKSA